jgi:hypothetical protein
MNIRIHYFGWFLGLMLVLDAKGQFYAPDVCLHDSAQRLFVGEAARVLAWIENQGLKEDERIMEVSWVETGDAMGKAEWKISWKDADGNEKRQMTVNYGGQALGLGADWYRQIWRQLRGIEREGSLPDAVAQSAPVLSAFWEGAELAGTSRMEGLLAAVETLGEGDVSKKAVNAGNLAGIMSHSAMSMLGGACMLDGLSLARAAAWLCHAEETVQANVPLAWAPLIYLAGREPAAAEIWRQAWRKGEEDGVVVRWWNRVLENYPASAKDLVLFAAEPESRQRGLPFLLAHLRTELAHRDEFNGVIRMLYDEDLELWPDSGGSMMRIFGVNGSQGYYASFPVLSRVRWLQTIGHVASPEVGGTHPDVAQAAVKVLTAIGADTTPDRAIRGLEEAGELITRGYDLRADVFAPVAVVTVEDLLVYGWDMTLDSMHAWHSFLSRQLGVRDAANEVHAACQKSVPTLLLFLERKSGPLTPHKGQDRVTFCEEREIGMEALMDISKAKSEEEATKMTGRNALKGLYSRGGLVFSQFAMMGRMLTEEERWNAVLAVGSQAGEAVVSRLNYFLQVNMKPELLNKMKEDKPTFAKALEQGNRNAIVGRRTALVSAAMRGAADMGESAEALERLYWEAPDSTAAAQIWDFYLRANAKNAAKRYYQQSRDHGKSSVAFSNEMPPRQWALAWWERDEAMMAIAAQDAPSFSARDLEKKVIHALAIGNDEDAAAIVRAYVGRYPTQKGQPEGFMEELQRFLPLLPALGKPEHAKHGEALAFFKSSNRWVLLRLVLARRFGLSQEKTLQLFGSGVTDYHLTKAVVAHMQRNKEEFQVAHDQIIKLGGDKLGGASLTLLQCLRHDLMATPEPKDQPDLKPERVVQLDDLVRNKLSEKR